MKFSTAIVLSGFLIFLGIVLTETALVFGGIDTVWPGLLVGSASGLCIVYFARKNWQTKLSKKNKRDEQTRAYVWVLVPLLSILFRAIFPHPPLAFQDNSIAAAGLIALCIGGPLFLKAIQNRLADRV